jgi:hypothetical protein
MSLYSVRSNGEAEFTITKFDNDLNPEATYALSLHECDCPAGHRPTCRHRQMLPIFLARDAVDSGAFYDFEGKQWFAPLEADEDGLEKEYENDGDIADDQAVSPAPVSQAETTECVPNPKPTFRRRA